MQGILDDIQVAVSASDHTADWREYIQRPTVYAPPVADMCEVVQWMRERPGTTEPGQYPTALAERAEGDALYVDWLFRRADADRKRAAKRRADVEDTSPLQVREASYKEHQERIALAQ